MRTVNRDIVGGFIFSSDGKVLLGKSYKGGIYPDLWIVPGGGIKADETRLDALRREMLEETGLDVTSGHIEDVSSAQQGEGEKTLRDTGETVFVRMNFFDYKITLHLPADKLPLKTDQEFTNSGWFSADEVKDFKFSKTTEHVLRKIGFLTT